jgi:hypothetical protein
MKRTATSYLKFKTYNLKLLLFLLLVLPFSASANPGDTTTVQVHNKTFINWYGPFYKWGTFPSAGKKYHKVIMKYTLQCAPAGCSDYDYTQKIYIRKKGSVNAAPINIEIGRMINAFGGGINQAWIRTYRYDVTDYAYLLNDSVEIGTNFEGYPVNSQGWLMTMDFEMIEGTPVREAYKVENVWNGYFPYGKNVGGVDTIEQYLYPKKIAIDSFADQTFLKIVPTGHGFGGSENCAEFCIKSYSLKINNSIVGGNTMWRDDCGLNPVYPGLGAQSFGTWLYDRANWCPGDLVHSYMHNLSSSASPGDSIDIDVDMQDGQPGDYTGYNFESQLISYKSPSFTNDATLEDIVSPSTASEYARMNPVCGSPEVIIKNTGTDDLTSLTITYGVEGETQQVYNWSGNLKFLETEHVVLAPVDLSAGPAVKYFTASVSNPNGIADEYALNNSLKVNYKTVPVYAEKFIVNIYTNADVENYCTITDLAGNIVYENQLSEPGTNYMDTVNLPAGCYKFVLEDFGKDGLSWPFGSTGGYARFKKINENKFWTFFNANFGTSIIHYFSTSANVGLSNESSDLTIHVYPNPSTGNFMIEDLLISNADKKLTIYDVTGKLMKEELIDKNVSEYRFDLSGYAPGIYSLALNADGKILRQKLTVMPK